MEKNIVRDTGQRGGFMVCCVTGHRSKGFPFVRDIYNIAYIRYITTLEREVELLARDGYRDFITGMAEGADIDFAYMVLALREAEGYITLEAALPYPINTSKRESESYNQKNEILVRCDRKTVVSPYYHRGCMQKRNQYMVDHSDIIFAIWNGVESGGTWNTIQYARTKGKEIRYLMLKEFL